jgi:hypothetical protein
VHPAAAYDPLQPVTIVFPPPGGLPHGGYYYAAAVLETPSSSEASCARSSDMSRTPYGYPRPRHWVTLTLYPAGREWCDSHVYTAAVYAVPHPPRCDTQTPCSSRAAYECPGPERCVATGVLLHYAGLSLPKPIDHTARIVARFSIRFPDGPPSVPTVAEPGLLATLQRAAAQSGEPHPTQIEAVRTTLGAAARLNNSIAGPTLADEPIYLVAARGRFNCGGCSTPRGRKAPTGTVITLELPVFPPGVAGFGLRASYPDLGLLGDPVALGP